MAMEDQRELERCLESNSAGNKNNSDFPWSYRIFSFVHIVGASCIGAIAFVKTRAVEV